ncbi:MAG: hypothetical protein HY741_30265 [Chloroflexi bacterium]|nr:hypothetical protein [Chloroflexota bacterium]
MKKQTRRQHSDSRLFFHSPSYALIPNMMPTLTPTPTATLGTAQSVTIDYIYDPYHLNISGEPL